MKRRYIFLVAIISFIAGYQAAMFLAEDACMDAGGVWRDRPGLCEGIEWHEPESDGR